jgi:transcriptional regulator with XRE-family HTH domain
METPEPNTTPYVPFGMLLKQRRLAAGLSQEQLAERACMSVRAISAYERGERTAPYRETVHLLAEALGLGASEQAVLEAAVPRGVSAEAETGAVLLPPADRPPPTDGTAASGLDNLPLPPTPFLGREQELAVLRARMRCPEVRLLCLLGTGGVGKTRLALQLAAQVRADFPAGVCFVGLAALSDPVLVPSAIAQALGVRERADRPLLETLQASLRGRQLLLVLDNFEHLPEAAPVVSALLIAAAGLNALVTSRAVLRLSGEQEVWVPPLALPGPATLPREELLSYAAVRLFVERAQAIEADFALTVENGPVVAAICSSPATAGRRQSGHGGGTQRPGGGSRGRQRRPPRRAQIRLDHLADHVVREAIGPLLLHQQARTGGGLQAGQQVTVRMRGHRDEQRRFHYPADHRRDAQQFLRLLRQRRDALLDGLRHRPWVDSLLTGLLISRSIGGHLGGPRVADQEEGHASGQPHQALSPRRAHGLVLGIRFQERVEQLPCLRRAQGSERMARGEPRVRQIGQSDQERILWVYLGVPVRADQPQADVEGRMHHAIVARGRRLVAPCPLLAEQGLISDLFGRKIQAMEGHLHSIQRVSVARRFHQGGCSPARCVSLMPIAR